MALVQALRLLLLCLLLGTWQFASGTPGDRFVLIDKFYVSQPTDVISAIQRWETSGQLWSSVLTTMTEVLIGFAVGVCAGMTLGFLVGTSRWATELLRPFIVSLNSIPRLALVPLFLLWFGLGLESKIVFVATIVFFLVFFTTYAGVIDVDEQLVDLMKLMRSPRWKVHTKVTLPSAMTWIIAGLGVSVPYALVAAVTAEMIASNRGLGYLLVRASAQFDTAGVFAAIVILMILGATLLSLVTMLEKRLLRWKLQHLRK